MNVDQHSLLLPKEAAEINTRVTKFWCRKLVKNKGRELDLWFLIMANSWLSHLVFLYQSMYTLRYGCCEENRWGFPSSCAVWTVGMFSCNDWNKHFTGCCGKVIRVERCCGQALRGLIEALEWKLLSPCVCVHVCLHPHPTVPSILVWTCRLRK